VQLERVGFVDGVPFDAGFVVRTAHARTTVGPANNAKLAAHLLQRGERNRERLGGFGLPHAEEHADGVEIHADGKAPPFENAVCAGLAPGEHADCKQCASCIGRFACLHLFRFVEMMMSPKMRGAKMSFSGSIHS